MKKIIFSIMLGMSLGLSTTCMYSMLSSTMKRRTAKRKVSWTHFNNFTKKHPYRLSKDGVETSSPWRKAAVRAAQQDGFTVRTIARHIAIFTRQEAEKLFYEENLTIYKDPSVARQQAQADAEDLSQHEELTIRILYDPTFNYDYTAKYY